MKRLSGLAFWALAIVGCGGNSGTQIATISRSLDIQSGSAYPDAAPVGAVGGTQIAPLASFTTKSSQQVVVWGSRDGAGHVSGVHEMAYTAPGVAPLYAKYDEAGGLATVLDTGTGSYVTFGALDGASILCTGYDGTRNRIANVRATLSDIGVTVEILSSGDANVQPASRFVSLSDLFPVTRAPRTLVADDPLVGITGTFNDSDERTRIVQALLHAAGLVVKAPFDGVLRDVAGFMLLDRFTQSYGQFTAKGRLPSVAASGVATPLAYRSDLP